LLLSWGFPEKRLVYSGHVDYFGPCLIFPIVLRK